MSNPFYLLAKPCQEGYIPELVDVGGEPVAHVGRNVETDRCGRCGQELHDEPLTLCGSCLSELREVFRGVCEVGRGSAD